VPVSVTLALSVIHSAAHEMLIVAGAPLYVGSYTPSDINPEGSLKFLIVQVTGSVVLEPEIK
jgi:hypothetical protein